MHGEMDHDFTFCFTCCDIVEKAEEIIRTYVCACGARKVEVFSLTNETITPGKEKDCGS